MIDKILLAFDTIEDVYPNGFNGEKGEVGRSQVGRARALLGRCSSIRTFLLQTNITNKNYIKYYIDRFDIISLERQTEGQGHSTERGLDSLVPTLVTLPSRRINGMGGNSEDMKLNIPRSDPRGQQGDKSENDDTIVVTMVKAAKKAGSIHLLGRKNLQTLPLRGVR